MLHQVVKALYHDGFDMQHMLNDIALLKVQPPIRYNNKVQPIALASNVIGADIKLTLSGWGLTRYPGNPSDMLKCIELRSITTADCDKLQPNDAPPITQKQLCTFNRVGEGSCQGDSGGPLIVGGKLAGIVSWGQPCAIGFPDVFTRVSSYIDWILSVTENN